MKQLYLPSYVYKEKRRADASSRQVFPKEKKIFPKDFGVAAEQVRKKLGYLRTDNSRASGSYLRLCAGGGEETGGRLTNTLRSQRSAGGPEPLCNTYI